MVDKIKLVVFAISVFTFDYYVYSGWKWVTDYETCVIEGVKQICWGTSPLPMYILTLAAVIITMLFIWWVINDFIHL